MPPINEATAKTLPTRTDTTASRSAGGRAYVADIARRLGRYFVRSQSRQRVMAQGHGLLSEAERQNRWQVAEAWGNPTPYGFQYVLARADGDAELGRDELRTDILQHLGDPHGVLVLEETGVVKQGRHSAGGARQDTGTVGNVANCPIGVFLRSAGPLGHVLVDRERYWPKAWTDERVCCEQAGSPADRPVATKPPLARQLLARAFAAGGPAQRGTGDRVAGDERRLRLWLEAQPQPSVLAVLGQDYVQLGWQPRQGQRLLATLPADGWTRLRAGEGAKGPRWYDWHWLSLTPPLAPGWCRWLLVRRSVSEPTDWTASVVCAPQVTTWPEGVGIAGSRGTMERGFEEVKGAVGLDHSAVRSWTGWDSAYDAREVGIGPPDGPASGDDRGRGLKKKSAAPLGGESAGGVQGQARPLLPLSVPKWRRLLWR